MCFVVLMISYILNMVLRSILFVVVLSAGTVRGAIQRSIATMQHNSGVVMISLLHNVFVWTFLLRFKTRGNAVLFLLKPWVVELSHDHIKHRKKKTKKPRANKFEAERNTTLFHFPSFDQLQSSLQLEIHYFRKWRQCAVFKPLRS